MINWRYFFPFIFLITGLSFFVHFVWLPSYLEHEHNDMLKQEKEYSSLLATTLVPSLLSGDLAEIKSNLDQVMKTRGDNLRSIELYTEDNVRLYPIAPVEQEEQKNGQVITTNIMYDGHAYGKIVSTMDVDEIIQKEISEIYELELILITVLVIFVFISGVLQYRWVKKPIQEMMMATAALARGEYAINLPKKLSRDLYEFVTSFDQMRVMLKSRAEKIERQQEIQSAVREVQSFFVSSDDAKSVFNRVLDIVIKITKSNFGFIGEIKYDSENKPFLNTFSLTNISWDVESRLAYERSIEGSITFTNLDTLFGQVMVTGKPVISNEPANDERSGGVPAGHPTIECFFGIPIYNRQNKLLGMVGVANSAESYADELYEELSVLWLAIGNLIDAQNEKMLLAENEQNLRAIVDNALEAIISIDVKGNIVSFNPSAEKMFGYSSEEVFGRNIKILMPEEHSKRHDKYLDNFVNGGKPKIIGAGREVEGLRKDGTTFQMELSVTEIKTSSKLGFTGIVRDITERKQKEEELIKAREQLKLANRKLKKIARTDVLTGLENRRSFDETFKNEMARAARQKYPITLMLFDVDKFKDYNDFYGHIEGDACLVKIAQAVNGLFNRTGDLIARYGGEEFSVILPHTDRRSAEKMAELLLSTVSQLKIDHAETITAPYVTVSVGVVSVIPDNNMTTVDLLAAADKALYKAKEKGRNQACFSKTTLATPIKSGENIKPIKKD